MPIGERAAASDLRIRSQQGDYDVAFVDNATSLARSLADVKDAFVVVDATVRDLYPSLFTGFDDARILTLPANEETKTLAGVERVALFLQQGGASKASGLILVGGGIIQDIGTFAAHIYYRGIPYTFVPTTLLSMADSCIGAKCGVNLGAFKNQLGFFQSPARVAIFPGFLQTLPPDDVRSGFGEVLKLSITAGADAFAWFEDRMATRAFAIDDIRVAIERSLETKRGIIEVDEYERDLRKTLNYGHTFGHALESVTENDVPHGLAVAWGVDVANFVATRMGLLDETVKDRVHLTIGSRFCFTTSRHYDAATLLRAMRRDKKVTGGNVQLILPSDLGALQIVPTSIDGPLESHIAEYLSREDICSFANF